MHKDMNPRYHFIQRSYNIRTDRSIVQPFGLRGVHCNVKVHKIIQYTCACNRMGA